MKTYKQTLLGRLIPSTFYIFFLFIYGCTANREIVVDSIEEIIIYTNSGPVIVLAKIDTGSTSSSIDASFVEKYGFDPYISSETGSEKCPAAGQTYIVNANGGQCRDRVKFSFILKGKTHSNQANVADRSALSSKVLIGNLDTSGKYLVRPVIPSGKTNDLEGEAEEEKKD